LDATPSDDKQLKNVPTEANRVLKVHSHGSFLSKIATSESDSVLSPLIPTPSSIGTTPGPNPGPTPSGLAGSSPNIPAPGPIPNEFEDPKSNNKESLFIYHNRVNYVLFICIYVFLQI
jgi:hypothetical protein